MKIEVAEIKPNPFRNIQKYKLDKEKVNALKASIKDTSFWDNLLIRQNNKGEYELAYGHHRLAALKELGEKTIDVPVREFDDAMMLKVMANENMDDWKTRPWVIVDTVETARDFLDRIVTKIKTLPQSEQWDAARADKNISPNFDSREAWNSSKGQGVGTDFLHRFLGEAWKRWHIQFALDVLKLEKDCLPGCGIVPANMIVLHRRDAWAATRYSLYRDKRRESSRGWEPKLRHDNKLYALKTLAPDDVLKFIAFLDEQKIKYEVV